MTVEILTGDALTILASMPADSVNCVVTSPPYYGLRDYGTAQWIGGDPECGHALRVDGGTSGNLGIVQTHAGRRANATCPVCGARRSDDQIGLEEAPDAYVARLVEVFREIRRVLRHDGIAWINLGDSYATRGTRNGNQGGGLGHRCDGHRSGYRGPTAGLKHKDLIGIPFRVAFALQADGWWWRSCLPWLKRNGMPERTADRPTTSVEYVFMMTKSARCAYDADAVAVPASPNTNARVSQNVARQLGSLRAHAGAKVNGPMKAVVRRPKSAELRTGVRSNTSFHGYGEANLPNRNFRNADLFWLSLLPALGLIGDDDGHPIALDVPPRPFKGAHFATFPPDLVKPLILAGCPEGGTVLDPFGGSGTTAVVADALKRNAILIDLNPAYTAMADRRVHGELFSGASP